MKISTLATMTVLGGTVASSLFLSPLPKQPARPVAPIVAATLPITGPATDIRRINHATDLEAPLVPTELYEQYVPPPPPPPPAPAPIAAAAPRVWAPQAGYVTIPVPIYRQAMTLDCETSALRMGLAAFGHYYSDSALFAYEGPDTRAPVMGPNHTVVQWGDPYTNFVGNVWGCDYTPTEYGVLRYLDGILTIDPEAGQERWARAVLRFQAKERIEVYSPVARRLEHSFPLRQVKIVRDQEVRVLEHGQIDFGADHPRAITILDRVQRVRRVFPAPDALMDLQGHLAPGGRADHRVGMGRLYHLE